MYCLRSSRASSVDCRAPDARRQTPGARHLALGALLLVAATACNSEARRAQRVADSLRVVDSIRVDSLRRDSIARAIQRADSIRADSIRTDSLRRADSLAKARKRRSASAAQASFASTDTVPWPKLPTPLPGSLLPSHRIIAYYGNPLSRRMGILGELPPEQMMARLDSTAQTWAEADSSKTVIPALHLIVTVAQGSEGRDGMHRLRMTDSLIERVARWAESRQWLLFLDVQVGRSTVQAELPRLIPYLERPYVHLALDPEFAMKGGARPGKKIGTMDASEVNYAIGMLADVVQRMKIPPKVLVVHRFTEGMLTNADKIIRDPHVQVVIDMDGFGSPALKRSTWRHVIQRDPVQYTGFKLFYKNDKPMLTPEQVIGLYPSPLYIQYQ
jgi:hypothetical protein